MDARFAAVEPLLAEHAEIEARLADPDVHADQGRARALGRRYAELGRVVEAYRRWRQAEDDAAAAAELADEDESFAQELPALREAADAAAEALRRVLVPRDPDDARDVILEIRAGEGGEESALFAGDLLRMYLRYAERVGWKTESRLVRAQPSAEKKFRLAPPPGSCARPPHTGMRRSRRRGTGAGQ